MQLKKHPTLIILFSCTVVLLCFGLTVLVIALYNHMQEANKPGTIVFSEEPNQTLLDFLDTIDASSLELKHDVELSTYTTLNNQPVDEADILYGVRVATVNFYNPVINLDIQNADELLSLDNPSLNIIPIQTLSSNNKLLSLNSQYYLDTFNSGALFDFVHLSGDQEDVVKITTLFSSQLTDLPDRDDILSLAQTGVTALARGMYSKLRSVGDASYFTVNLANFFNQFDYKHTSNESSFSTSANANNICAAPAMIDVITSLDFNIIELTGNHNLDCGDNDALSTLDTYARLDIDIVGGGANAEAAAQPLEIDSKDTHLTILAYNYSTGGYTLDQTPGANFFTLEKATTDIRTAKERGDFIIVDVQYFECNAYDNTAEDATCDYANATEGDQISFFRQLIDLGANIVVGTAAHQPQAFEQYNNGLIFYGLGNLFFDQSWWPGTTRSLILVHYFLNNNLIQTRIVPTIYDSNYQTKLMDNKTAEWFIERLNRARPKE